MTPVRLRTQEEEKISFRIPRRILFAAGECWAGEKRGGGEENEVKNHCWYRFVNMLRRSLIALLHLFRISCFYQEGTIFIALLALLPPPLCEVISPPLVLPHYTELPTASAAACSY